MQTELLYIKKSLPDPLLAYKELIKIFSSDSVLLESQKNGKLSYIALDPYMTFKSKNKKITIIHPNKTEHLNDNPLNILETIFENKKIKPDNNLPLFSNGAIGYFSYDCVRHYTNLPYKAIDDLNLPDIYLIFPNNIIVFDHEKNKISIISKNNKEKKIKNILENINNTTVKTQTQTKTSKKTSFISNFSKEKYKNAVNKCKDFVSAGDSYQIKISQRFHSKINQDPLEIYTKLKNINPSPYAAFLNFKNLQLVSCSPEHLVKVEKNKVETRPIGGTYPVSNDPKEDKKIREQFINDPKENAEHTMLIDLERNDLGRVCTYGSIKVNELMSLERYSHLWHIVTNIQGELQPNKSIFDVFKSMFPGGTITGCPKKRTMEIIDEIEPVRRGPYTGSIGFMNFTGEMDLNLIIRTMIVKNNDSYIQVGGGIVTDSDPEKEYEETINKGQALFNAIN